MPFVGGVRDGVQLAEGAALERRKPGIAVTDARLRVNGVSGLRVVDASVMPKMVSGNTQAAVMMVAERGAEMILEDAQ